MNIIPYNKRDLATAQNAHEDFVRRQLRSLSSKEPEFLGYAQDDHRLAKKDFGLHPRVPMFQFDHFKHGSMEITTRNTLNSTYITAAYAGHPTHLLGRRQINDLKQRMKRDEVYDHELFKTGVLEARFDGDASEADPASIEPEAGKLFDTFEPEVECFMSDGYKGGNVLDVQMYDKTNKATFGFGMTPSLLNACLILSNIAVQALLGSLRTMKMLTQLKIWNQKECLFLNAINHWNGCQYAMALILVWPSWNKCLTLVRAWLELLVRAKQDQYEILKIATGNEPATIKPTCYT